MDGRVIGVILLIAFSSITVGSSAAQWRTVMDPITATILAVLPSLTSGAVPASLTDAYERLKAVIHRKWGAAAPVSRAIAAIEEDPTSKAQAAVLEEKVEAVKATEDVDVAQALRALVEQMKAHGIESEAVARIQFTITGGTLTGIIGAQSVTISNLRIEPPVPFNVRPPR
jgi:hypothetical protein